MNIKKTKVPTSKKIQPSCKQYVEMNKEELLQAITLIEKQVSKNKRLFHLSNLRMSRY